MKAVILAGGLGTRLRPLTYTRPKPMLPIASKPILHYIVKSLAIQGFDEIIVTTNRSTDKPIRKFLGKGSEYGVDIVYSRESKPLGTAGAVKKVEKRLDDTFSVIQGDNITEINFAEEFRFHRSKGGITTLAVKEVERPWLFGIVQLDVSGKILRFTEKPKADECFSNLASVGLYVLEPDVLDYIPKKKEFDFAKDLFSRLLELKLPVYGYKTTAFWTDVGIVEGYMEATRWILSKMPNYVSDSADISGANIDGKVWIEDDVIIKPNAKVVGPVLIENDAIIDANAYVGPGSVIKNNVEVGSKSEIDGSIIYEETRLKRETDLQRCIVGENCNIGNHVKIEEHAIIGPNCRIGDEAHICKRSRIWPNLKINPGSIIAGIVRRFRR